MGPIGKLYDWFALGNAVALGHRLHYNVEDIFFLRQSIISVIGSDGYCCAAATTALVVGL
jgi:hypothetical protein